MLDLRAKTWKNYATMNRFFAYIAVACGGGLGTLGRCGLFFIADESLRTFVCNILGTLIMAAALETRRLHPTVRKSICVGFCGGLSVFSGFAQDCALALANARYAHFAAVFFGNFAACILIACAVQTFADKRRTKWTS